jgi:hypothetical protein
MDVISRKGGLGHSELEGNFSISQVQLSEHKWAQLENAVDIKIENSELKKHIGKRQEFIYKMPVFYNHSRQKIWTCWA